MKSILSRMAIACALLASIARPNFLNWHENPVGYWSVVWDGSRYLLTSSVGILTSNDARKWRPITKPKVYPNPNTMEFDLLATNGSTTIAIGPDDVVTIAGDSLKRVFSLDSAGLIMQAVTWTGKEFLALGYDISYDSGWSLCSKDGSNWVSKPIDRIFHSTYQKLVPGDSGVLLLTTDSVYHSRDGNAWEWLPFRARVNDVAWGNGKYYVGGDEGMLAYSLDGRNWHEDSTIRRSLAGISMISYGISAVPDTFNLGLSVFGISVTSGSLKVLTSGDIRTFDDFGSSRIIRSLDFEKVHAGEEIWPSPWVVAGPRTFCIKQRSIWSMTDGASQILGEIDSATVPSDPNMPLALEGIVLNMDGSARQGVVVSIAGQSLSTTTSSDGRWVLARSSGIKLRKSSSLKAESRLAFDRGRLVFSIGGTNVLGRASARTTSPVGLAMPKREVMAARELSSWVDTIEYSWNGKVFLRDTIQGVDRPEPMVRRFDSTVNPNIFHGYLHDKRDGRIYRTIRFGMQEWMAENLDFVVDSSWYNGVYHPGPSVYVHPDTARRYGLEYTWPSAMGIDPKFTTAPWEPTLRTYQGVCPAGWRLPELGDWMTVSDKLDPAAAGAQLRQVSGWNDGRVGIDQWGFHVQPRIGYVGLAGYQVGPMSKTLFWTSSEYVNGESHAVDLASMTNKERNVLRTKDRDYRYPVRCIRE